MPPHARMGRRACRTGAFAKGVSAAPTLSPLPVQDETHPYAKSREDRSEPRRRRPERLPGRQVRGDLHDVRLPTGPNGDLPDYPVAVVDFQHDVLDAGARRLPGEDLRLRFGSPDREVLFRDVGGGDDLSSREVDDVLREHAGIVDEVDLRPRRFGRDLLIAVGGLILDVRPHPGD